jgi:hypothetical protein
MILDKCSKELQGILKTDFHFDTVNVIPFSAGTHWVSMPLKVVGEGSGTYRSYLAKVVTDEGVRTYREIVAGKNARFRRHDILDLSYWDSNSAYDILQREELFLEKARRADIFVPAPFGVYQLTSSAVLIMQFVDGAPLERLNLRERDISNVFNIVKQLRVHRLIHGDIRRDNFLVTAGHDVCLLDSMWLTGNTKCAADYDLMSAICHLSLSADPLVVCNAAYKFFSAAELKETLPFLNFITRRLTHRERDKISQIISWLP